MLTHPLLSFNHISITDESDDKRILLDDVTGVLHSGEQVVLMGASGSGKSLLLSALAGQLPLAHGQISLHADVGVLEQASTPPPLWRDKVALVTQTPVMMDGTVLDNLQLPFSFGHHKGKQFDHHSRSHGCHSLVNQLTLSIKTSRDCLAVSVKSCIFCVRYSLSRRCYCLMNRPQRSIR